MKFEGQPALEASKNFFKFISLIIGKNLKNNSGGGQNFERRNVERLTFRNFKIANIKITKNELFDSYIIEFISFFRNYLNTQNIE